MHLDTNDDGSVRNSPISHSTIGAVLPFERTPSVHRKLAPPTPTLLAALCMSAAIALPGAAHAQVTLKPDGQWRYLFTASANATTGNSDTANLNAKGDAVRMTETDKLTFTGQASYANSDGAKTTQRLNAGSQYNRDFSPRSFGFGTADFVRDRPSNIASRFSVATGVGRHVLRGEDNSLDLSLGVGYSGDRYVTPSEVADSVRSTYGRLEGVLAEESNHKLSSNTSLRQKLTVYPNLRDSTSYRAQFDVGVTVAMTPTMNLTTGVNYRYNNDPGTGLKRTDAALVTGVSFRFD